MISDVVCMNLYFVKIFGIAKKKKEINFEIFRLEFRVIRMVKDDASKSYHETKAGVLFRSCSFV